MIPFELNSAALHGVHLIEAGAGTGKTYTIAALFLRLIVEQGLSINQILVVTYTKAATEELKTRIRQRLFSARNAFTEEKSADPLIAAMQASGVDCKQAQERIRGALVDFDQAAIFTIHGFCQRVLHHFAFETGHLFAAELAQDAQPLIQEAADDFWRRHISRAPIELVRFVVKHLNGPEELAALFNRCRFPRARVIPASEKPLLTAIRPWRRVGAQVRELWRRQRDAVTALLLYEGLNAQQYGKCEPHHAHPQLTYRQVMVAALATAMDQWDGNSAPFERFERFSAARLAKATKKKFTTLQHPFFELCDQALACWDALEQQMVAYLRYLKVRLLAEFHQRLARKKAMGNILFFDDLLLQVHHALQGGQQQGLTQAIQLQYRAALVDEFQDTDGLQYEIFAQLFANGPCLLFMIGDPKQAIYSFRGADLFSYLRAKQEAHNQYTLTRNWRATPSLIQALNTLFGSHPRPFGYDQIPFERAVAGRSGAVQDATPFHLWYLTRTHQDDLKRPIAQQEAVPRIVAAVAQEIVTLLAKPDKSLAPEDIAVLTRTHRQAQQVKAALAQRRVPAVLHSAGRVFDAPEAGQLALVLAAVAFPADPRRVRSALSGDLLGASAHELCASMEAPGDRWQQRWALFEEYHHTWLRHGFFRMFSRLMATEGVKPRLLALPDGERRLTNVLHLAELLHQACVAHQLGPEAAIKWLTAQRAQGGEGEEAQKLRLESDAHAVRIITIHKSKGLQFEVVFCPFTWAGVKEDDKSVTFHDCLHQDQLTVAIGPQIAPEHQQAALEEALFENLRLLYVALTRARRCCYMAWGCIKGTERSAPAYLLHGPRTGADQQDGLAALQRKMASMTDALLLEELTALARGAGGTIAVQALPMPTEVIYTQPSQPSGALQQREFKGRIESNWRIASFSAMTAELGPEAAQLPDRDEAVVVGAEKESARIAPDHLFGFSKGARPGLFFHDLLEHWDFSNSDTGQRQRLTAQKLAAHGFEAQWQTSVDTMLQRLTLAHLPGPAQAPSVRLADVALDQRVNEMEFYFPLRPLNPEKLEKAFGVFRQPLGAEKMPYALDRLTFAPMQGFMKGYMDMVFTHNGRYYLVDWKSNHLGDEWADYATPRLNQAMTANYYFLQYHLYTVALDQLLRRRIKDYDYEQHFGGVYYLFLRGIQGPDSTSGIFYDLPEKRLIESLRDVLIEDER